MWQAKILGMVECKNVGMEDYVRMYEERNVCENVRMQEFKVVVIEKRKNIGM